MITKVDTWEEFKQVLDDKGGLKPDTAKFLGSVLEKFAAFAAKNI